MAHLVESVGLLLGALESWKGGSSETREALNLCFFRRAVSNQCLKRLCWCSLGRSPRNWCKLATDRKISFLTWWRWETCRTYFSKWQEKTGKPLRWWTFGESLGVSTLSLCLEDVAWIALGVGSVISSTVPFKIVCKGAYCRFWKSPGLGCLVSREQKTTTLLSSSSI